MTAIYGRGRCGSDTDDMMIKSLDILKGIFLTTLETVRMEVNQMKGLMMDRIAIAKAEDDTGQFVDAFFEGVYARFVTLEGVVSQKKSLLV